MQQSKIHLPFLFFFLALSVISYAQIQKGNLSPDKLTTADIEPGDSHQYLIELEEGQLAFFKLTQQGVDMKIATYDTKGEKLADFDSPNGKQGPEPFDIRASVEGTYKIIVSPYDEEEPSGNYSLQIKTIRDKATTPEGQVDQLFIPWDNSDSPGASVAVVKDGKIIYKKGYGMANLEYDIPNSSSTIFHVASVSKQFTVFSILLLEKEGKLSLEDDIRKYIPEVPDFGKTITLRHLASHTSGMRDQWNLLSMAGWRFDDVITKEHVTNYISSNNSICHPLFNVGAFGSSYCCQFSCTS